MKELVHRTLLSEHHEPLASFSFRNIQMLLLQPPKQCDPLRQHSIPLEIIRRNGTRWNALGQLRSEGAGRIVKEKVMAACIDSQLVEPIHYKLLHTFHRIIKICVADILPNVTFTHLSCNKLMKVLALNMMGRENVHPKSH